MPRHRGLSLRPLVEGRALPRWQACRVAETHGPTRMVRTPEGKLFPYRRDPMEQLFELRDDVGETVKLAEVAATADVIREVHRQLDDWERRLDICSVQPSPVRSLRADQA